MPNQAFTEILTFTRCARWNTESCPNLKDHNMQLSIINKPSFWLLNDQTVEALNRMCDGCKKFFESCEFCKDKTCIKSDVPCKKIASYIDQDFVKLREKNGILNRFFFNSTAQAYFFELNVREFDQAPKRKTTTQKNTDIDIERAIKLWENAGYEKVKIPVHKLFLGLKMLSLQQRVGNSLGSLGEKYGCCYYCKKITSVHYFKKLNSNICRHCLIELSSKPKRRVSKRKTKKLIHRTGINNLKEQRMEIVNKIRQKWL